MNDITVFLPIRSGSQRVENKNTKDFSGIKGGLTFVKISQLLKVRGIGKIVISTNCNKVEKIAKSFNSNKIVISRRPEHLGSSNTLMEDLIRHVPTIINSGTILWTHVTSPFVDESIYENMIAKYFDLNNKYDSFMSVTKIQKFLWNKYGPINYDRGVDKWPKTQSIESVYEVNSGAFMADISIYKSLNDRIGNCPYFYELSEKEALDIDWKDDFEIAEILWNQSSLGV